MSTGACGIDCTTCRLHVMGICSTCGAGNSDAGRDKLAAQNRLFGSGCPILSCAVERGMAYCLRDCNEFPCGEFSARQYPFSQGFLDMQSRRRTKIESRPLAAWPITTADFWAELEAKRAEEVCANSGAVFLNGNYRLQCLNEVWEIDVQEQRIFKVEGFFGGEWDRQVPFLLLLYLVKAQATLPSGEMAAPRELVKGGDFFQGRYRLQTDELERVFGGAGDTFLEVAKKLGAQQTGGADFSVRFNVLPKLLVEYLLWHADEEFPPRVIILLGSDTTEHFPPDATAILVNLLTGRILSSVHG
jgi:hypothetical protein